MPKSNLHSDLKKKNNLASQEQKRTSSNGQKISPKKINLESTSHSSKIKNKTKMSIFTAFIQHYNEGYNQYNKVRNKIQRHKYQKARSKRKKMT